MATYLCRISSLGAWLKGKNGIVYNSIITCMYISRSLAIMLVIKNQHGIAGATSELPSKMICCVNGLPGDQSLSSIDSLLRQNSLLHGTWRYVYVSGITLLL